jgi:hypothetical protein
LLRVSNYQNRWVFQSLLRKTVRYQEWRQDVFNMIGKRCDICGTTKHLHVHHITAFATLVNQFLDQYTDYEIPGDEEILLQFAETDFDLWDSENGRVLCEFCHEIEHL